MEPATPADPTDALLRDWIKTDGGPMTFEGTPCSFPGRVWRSKVGAYYNMCKGFDIILDRFSRILTALRHPSCAVRRALLGGYAYGMLIGACNPMA